MNIFSHVSAVVRQRAVRAGRSEALRPEPPGCSRRRRGEHLGHLERLERVLQELRPRAPVQASALQRLVSGSCQVMRITCLKGGFASLLIKFV